MTKFQLIPSLLTYNYSLQTLRSSQLIQVPACFPIRDISMIFLVSILQYVVVFSSIQESLKWPISALNELGLLVFRLSLTKVLSCILLLFTLHLHFGIQDFDFLSDQQFVRDKISLQCTSITTPTQVHPYASAHVRYHV